MAKVFNSIGGAISTVFSSIDRSVSSFNMCLDVMELQAIELVNETVKELGGEEAVVEKIERSKKIHDLLDSIKS
ncbi:hypothetical protein [Campylobacter hyointestinalis]|uniref:hypothetical protein n=1 Tax=Campylobacter hyointestinalis TaxID=198 RepID=UPI000CE4726C|nr:hypothetical protein [Campylobacter hyointestinalis]PPB54643.1 hypothetical protein CDQ67_07585 [Campylobacter hyointestinalis subsp. hyointestinalis]